MSNKIISMICAIAVLMTCFAGAVHASADSDAIDRIISYCEKSSGTKSVQEYADTYLSENAGVLSEWYVIGISQYYLGVDFTKYAESLRKYISQNTSIGAASRQRCALALIASGCAKPSDTQDILSQTAEKQGIMSLIFALQLSTNGCVDPVYTADNLANKIIAAQNSDGGWAVSGDNSDVDVTAMALAALAAYISDANVKSACDKAVALLSSRQNTNGGYSSYGTENPESAAQVITALTACKINPLTDGRFVKNGKTALDSMLSYQLSDGSFCHYSGGKTNPTATMQALYALVALQRFSAGLGSLFVFDGTAVHPLNTVQPTSSGLPASATASQKTTKPTSSGNTEAAVQTAENTINNQASTAAISSDLTSLPTTETAGQRTTEKLSEADESAASRAVLLLIVAAVCAAAAAAAIAFLMKKRKK